MTRLWSWSLLAPALVLVGIILCVAFAPKARAAMEGLTEPESPRSHQLVECRPGEPCRFRGRPMGPTACDLDAVSLANVAPRGTVVRCQRVAK